MHEDGNSMDLTIIAGSFVWCPWFPWFTRFSRCTCFPIVRSIIFTPQFEVSKFLQHLCRSVSVAWHTLTRCFPITRNTIKQFYAPMIIFYVGYFVFIFIWFQKLSGGVHILDPSCNLAETLEVPESIQDDPGGITECQGLLSRRRYVVWTVY